jgi:hypothetical protein
MHSRPDLTARRSSTFALSNSRVDIRRGRLVAGGKVTALQTEAPEPCLWPALGSGTGPLARLGSRHTVLADALLGVATRICKSGPGTSELGLRPLQTSDGKAGCDGDGRTSRGNTGKQRRQPAESWMEGEEVSTRPGWQSSNAEQTNCRAEAASV